MGIGIGGMSTRHDGRVAPSQGKFPGDGPDASLFFHLLPDIEQDDVYRSFAHDPIDGPTLASVAVRTYRSTDDPTNPEGTPLLISFASNAAVFGLTDGGRPLFRDNGFKKRGSSNTITFMQRFAVIGSEGIRHTWNGRAERENYLYPPSEDTPGAPDMATAQFGILPMDARNDCAHAFKGTTIQVGLGDGSARTVTADSGRTFSYGNGRTATVWAWACSLYGPLGEAKTPDGW
jgi:hypothetical protein